MIASRSDGKFANHARRRKATAAMALGAVLVCLVSPDTYAAQKKHPAPTAQATEPAVKPDAAATQATPEPKPTESAPNSTKAATAWTPAEIADARARCAVVLQRVHAVALPHEPIREGACGAPGPVELISIGRNPEVALSPPAIVRCDLIEPLVTWFEQNVQPLARKLLKSEVIRIETMSSYDCRNVYGMKGAKLSQHALANALDIGGFITASAKTAEVLDEWGKPQREILAEAAERKQAAEAAASKTAQAGVTGNPVPGALPSMVPSMAGAAAAGLARSTIVDGLPRAEVIATASPINDANRLGGPALQRDAPTRPTPSIDNPDPKMQAFLHEAHKAACRIFGTTLGPEANAAHRNHFHVDMAERKFTKICD